MNKSVKDIVEKIEFLEHLYSYLTPDALERKSYREVIDRNVKELIELKNELVKGEI